MKKRTCKILGSIICNEEPALAEFIKVFLSNGDVYLFGGAVRTYLLEQSEMLKEEFFHKIRDLDFVFRGRNENRVIDLLKNSKYRFKENRFGGFKVQVSHIVNVDIWDIDNTWAFKNGGVMYRDEKDFLKTVFLNIDAGIYDLKKYKFYTKPLKAAFKKKELDIVLKNNPAAELNFLKALRYYKKYDMRTSKKFRFVLDRYVSENKNLVNDIYNAQMWHYGEVLFTRAEISSMIERLINHI